MSQEIDLLNKLYAFYSKRYNGTTLEEKFNAAVYDLVKTGDVQKSTYMEFCVDNKIYSNNLEIFLSLINLVSSVKFTRRNKPYGAYSNFKIQSV
jgi:hypothetical protein